MKSIQSAGGELSASSPVNDTKLEFLREALDSLQQDRNRQPPASPARSNRGRHFSKSTLLGIAALFGPLLASTGSAADTATATTVATPPTAASAAATTTAAVAASVATSTNATVAASAPKASPLFQKPAWLTDLSVGVKESYDDNVYLTGVDPVSKPLPVGGVLAEKNHSSFVTTVSPKVGVNFAPLLANQKTFQALTFSYAPDFVTYHDADTESYNNHRIANTVKGQVEDFSFNLDNTFNYIDGSKYGPSYPSGLNAYGTGNLRERREQLQDRSNLTLKYDQEKWFVRPTASLLYYDLETKQLAGYTGYQNYADRYDVNGGVDLGYKLNPDLAVTLGYRDGAQYQQKYSAAIDKYGRSASSDYQRVLLGIEGKPFSWLVVKLQGGPDFRNYDDSAPVSDYNPVKFYGEASLTATLSKQDSLSFNYRQWEWVSSTGEVPYLDSTYDLNYKHKFNDQLSANLGARLLGSDYTSGLGVTGGQPGHYVGTANARNDLFYTLSAGVQYAFNANFSASLTYSYDLGRNGEDGLSDAAVQAREFNHQLISLGATFKF
jgi:hypothetical protein